MNNVSSCKRIIILVFSIVLIFLFTYFVRFLYKVENKFLFNLLLVLLNLINGIVAIIAIRLTILKLDTSNKTKKQYFLGILIALGLVFLIGVIPILFGTSLIGNHEEFKILSFIFNLFFYIFIIGPVEEVIFRVYIQETFKTFFNKKYLAVLISSAIFGIWHIINGSIIQVIFTFFIGLVFGFLKEYLKDCTYLSVSIGHGFYDFSLYLLRLFVL